ncbi:MAG: hypothetical protein EPO06_00895 [Burkholderiaceae bacterium]|nr:MAG: hypothetical protein EPO06_00895 [Burkholderiaceae bacterium]
MFKRPHHQRIHTLLRNLDSDLLTQCQCYFAGGTAIVLLLDEYRESVDVDFLCASSAGYRQLRSLVFDRGLTALMRKPVKLLRDVRADRYGIRTFVEVDHVPIKFEIVQEGRIALEGNLDPQLGVPVLSRSDMYAEKLLANADRYNDIATASRDIIDLAMMINQWGPIPQAAWQKVRQAYGESAEKAYGKAIDLMSDAGYLSECLNKMQMDQQRSAQILAAFKD